MHRRALNRGILALSLHDLNELLASALPRRRCSSSRASPYRRHGPQGAFSEAIYKRSPTGGSIFGSNVPGLCPPGGVTAARFSCSHRTAYSTQTSTRAWFPFTATCPPLPPPRGQRRASLVFPILSDVCASRRGSHLTRAILLPNNKWLCRCPRWGDDRLLRVPD